MRQPLDVTALERRVFALHDFRNITRLILALAVSLVVALVVGGVAGRLLLNVPREDLGALLIAIVVCLLLLSAVAGWTVWRLSSRWVDWQRVGTEQKLWESGPIGRAWLKIRQRLASHRSLG